MRESGTLPKTGMRKNASCLRYACDIDKRKRREENRNFQNSEFENRRDITATREMFFASAIGFFVLLINPLASANDHFQDALSSRSIPFSPARLAN